MMILKRTGPTSGGGPRERAKGNRRGPDAPARSGFLMCCTAVIPKCSDSSYVTMPRLTVRGGQRA